MPDDFSDHQAITLTFLLEVDGVEIGSFKSVTGLEVSIDVETYQEGGQNGFSHRLPGRMSWPNIVMARGVTRSDSLFSWIERSSGDGLHAQGDKLERATAAITVLSSERTRLRSWNLEGAFPVRWKGPDLSSGTANALDEEIEISHHGFRAETHF